jgi:hypothetical protein
MDVREHAGQWRRWSGIRVLSTDASRRSLNWIHSSHMLHTYHNAMQLFLAIYVAMQPFLIPSSGLACISSVYRCSYSRSPVLQQLLLPSQVQSGRVLRTRIREDSVAAIVPAVFSPRVFLRIEYCKCGLDGRAPAAIAPAVCYAACNCATLRPCEWE